MSSPQQLVLSENFNFAIWLQADIVKPDNIRSGCLKSLSALSEIKQQFATDHVDMTIAFGADFWQSLPHADEGGEIKNFPSYGKGRAVATQCDL
ncbi:MAG: Dyp-type peroxidase, partial [Neisseriaceae bacterium]|nr:Dyp-type peroxidase [Neisseriaceae bacterium]